MVPPADRPPAPSRPYRGLDPEQRRLDRRTRLLDATLELSATHGFAPTTIQDICREAGVTARHFYEEFETRETLLETLYTDLVRQTVEVIIDTLRTVPPEPSAMVHEGLSAYMHAMLDDPRRARIILFEVFTIPGGVLLGERGVNSFVDLLASVGDTLAERDQLAHGHRPATGVAISGAMKELMIHWLRSDPQPPLDDLIASAEAILCRLLLLPEPGAPANPSAQPNPAT